MPKKRMRGHEAKASLEEFVDKKVQKRGREKNQYYFQGFYERLKSIDVKQSHSMSLPHNFDQFVGKQVVGPTDEGLDAHTRDEDMTESNFIEFLKVEKMNNKTRDFKLVFDDIEQLAFSHALVVVNRKQIVEKLVGYLRGQHRREEDSDKESDSDIEHGVFHLEAEKQEEQDENTDFVLKGKILGLIVALIKDLRSDIYDEFKELILPEVIQLIDVQDVDLLDQIFTLFSYSFKFLIKQIRDDISDFYEVFSHLLTHHNKHLRHFAAQSFSHVLRKTPIDEKLVALISRPLENLSEDEQLTHPDVSVVLGVSDIFYEIMYGANGNLHSKSSGTLQTLLEFSPSNGTKFQTAYELMIRFLYIKLIAAIDTKVQLPLFEAIHSNLICFDEQICPNRLRLALLLIQDAVKFKFGSRVSHLAVIQIVESMSYLLSQKTKAIKEQENQHQLLAATLSMVYYFKYAGVQQLYQQTQIDLATSKTIFTHHVFNVCDGSIQDYYKIFLDDPSAVKAEPWGFPLGMGYAEVIGLKKSETTTIEFTSQSHGQKLGVLIGPLDKFVQKSLPSKEMESSMPHIALFSQLVDIMSSCGQKKDFTLSQEAEIKLVESIGQSKDKAIELFNLIKYACIFPKSEKLLDVVREFKPVEFAPLEIDLVEDVQSNYIVKEYLKSEEEIREFSKDLSNLMSFDNLSYQDDIAYATTILFNPPTQSVIDNPSSILLLKRFHQYRKQEKFSHEADQGLADALSKNLIKNSRELRLISLQILSQFESLKFRKDENIAEEEEPSFFSGQDCPLFSSLYEIEKTKLGFEFEKDKEMRLRNLEVWLKSGLLPKQYILPVFNFLVGTLWVQFTPIFAPVQDCIAALISNLGSLEDKLIWISKIAGIQKTMLHAAQLAEHDNESLDSLIQSISNKQAYLLEDDDALGRTFVRSTLLQENSIDSIDFFFQITKSLHNIIFSVILPQKVLREPIFDLFFRFINTEYTKLYPNFWLRDVEEISGSDQKSVWMDRLVDANIVDGDVLKAHRKTSHSVLSAYLELFRKSDSLKQVPKIGEFQQFMVSILSSSDTKLQKHALDCLTKSNYAQGLMHKYKKLLDGFADDEQFKDMIPILIHGSQFSAIESYQKEEQEDAEMAGDDLLLQNRNDRAQTKAKRKETKSAIPKLEDQDRPKILPIIIKLLSSKILKKRGAINKKNITVRQNIVFQFYASFDRQKEFPLVLDELLLGVNLSLELAQQDTEVKKRVSKVNFISLVTFVHQFEAMFSQMGTLLTDFLPVLSSVLLKGIIFMSKTFTSSLKHLKPAEQEAQGDDESLNQGQSPVYRKAGEQSKDVLRLSLGIVKKIYGKFSKEKHFIAYFSELVYREVISDQLTLLASQYISDKSQLLEIVCVSWAQNLSTLGNFLKYDEIIPKVMGMLKHRMVSPDVAGLIVGLVKGLIANTVEDDVIRKRAAKGLNPEETSGDEIDLGSDGEQMVDQTQEEKIQVEQISIQLLKQNIKVICQSLSNYWDLHSHDLKHALCHKGAMAEKKKSVNPSTIQALNTKHTKQIQKFHIAKDLLYVLSELSFYLESGWELNEHFFDMIVQILSLRQIHSKTKHNDDLLNFGIKCLSKIIPKVKQLTPQQVDKLFQLFLHLQNPRIRQRMAEGLQSSLEGQPDLISQESLKFVCEMNQLKRGIADMETDCDRAIAAMQGFVGSETGPQTGVEVNAYLYNILNFCKHEEFSVREFSLHAFSKILEKVKQEKDQSVITLIEVQIVKSYLNTVKDDLILKSVLDTIKQLIAFFKDNSTVTSLYDLPSLSLLVTADHDFFAQCLSLKLKQRQKSLKLLQTSIKSGALPIRTLEHILLPIVNYMIFGGDSQMQNKRNTISYDAEQKRSTIEEGLGVYEAYASQLTWSDYFSLLKKLSFKLQKARNQANSVSAQGDPELQKERIVVKAICRVLDGFNFQGVKDAVETLKEKVRVDGGSGFLGKEIEQKINEDIEMKDEQPEAVKIQKPKQEILTNDKIVEIQLKLLRKVLPNLEQHMSDSKDKNAIRSFVVVCYAKIIRKLPVKNFQQCLHKVVNQIVVKGLRSRELSHREKARKALVKLVKEVTPIFLPKIFEEMKTQLEKGYQKHVYLFSLHHLLSGLDKEGSLEPGSISQRLIEQNSEVLLSELFGDLKEEKSNEQQNQLKQIKESKSLKSTLIYEILTKYVNFKTTFLALLAPIIKILEESPTVAKIQQCEDLLSRVSGAVLKNKTVDGPGLLVFLYSIIDKGIGMSTRVRINDEKEKRDYGQGVQTDLTRKSREELKEINLKVEMYWKKGSQTMNQKKSEEISGRVLATFGLQTLKRAIKAKLVLVDGQEEADKEQLRERLDPFVLLILRSFKTYHNPIVVTSLSLISSIVGLNLNSFKSNLGKFLNKIFYLFEQGQNSDSDFINSLLKCTSDLIRLYSVYQDLSPVQLKALLNILNQHTDKMAVQSNALSCFRQVIHKRFECPQIYDQVEQIQDIMITNSTAQIRNLCQSIFVEFLLEYPLHSDRVEQHINFLLKNLAFKRISGRLQVLSVLLALVQKLPAKILDVYGEIIFFKLLLQAVNEDDAECRKQVLGVMRPLIQKLPQQKVKAMLNTVQNMGSDDPEKQEQLKMAKLYAFQLMTEEKLKLQEIRSVVIAAYNDFILPSAQRVQKKVDKIKKSGKDDDADKGVAELGSFLQAIGLMDDEVPEAEEIIEERDEADSREDILLYYSLACIQKLLENQQPAKVISILCEVNFVTKCLVVFVQHHSNHWIRLMGHKILSQLLQFQAKSKESLILVLGLDVQEMLPTFSYSIIQSLKKQIHSDEMQNLLTRNLVFLVHALHEQREQCPFDPDTFFKKLSFIGRKVMLDIKTSKKRLETILNIFKTSLELLHTFDKGYAAKACTQILKLVQRTSTDQQYSGVITSISQDIIEFLQENIPKTEFIQMYSEVQTEIGKKRQEKKIKRKQLVNTDEGVQQQKRKRERKQQKKKEVRRQKIFMDKLHR